MTSRIHGAGSSQGRERRSRHRDRPRGGPSQINLRGRPSADGFLVLQGRIVGSGRNRGREVLVRYEGRLIDGKGTLTGRQGLRSCSITLELM